MEVFCRENEIYCSENLFLLFYPENKNNIYKIDITVDVPSHLKNDLKGIYFYANTVDSEYTRFLLGLRYTCLILSLIFGALYFLFYMKIPQ